MSRWIWAASAATIATSIVFVSVAFVPSADAARRQLRLCVLVVAPGALAALLGAVPFC